MINFFRIWNLNKPERVFSLQVRCRELDIFKIRNFLRNCLKIFWIFSGFLGGIFWIFLGFFLEDFFWRIFFGGFFWRIFLGGFSGRNSLFTLLKSAKLFESERDWCFCQDFVWIKKEEEGKKFRSSEVREQVHRT
jgi:hypothetical protein